MRSEDALRRALTQAVRAEAQGSIDGRPEAHAYARGARAALQWAVGDALSDPFGGVGIHEGDAPFYPPGRAP